MRGKPSTGRLLAAAALYGLISACGRNQTLPARADPSGLPTRDVSPRWSPDGKRIAFLRLFGDRLTQLWVCDGDLRNPRAVSEADSQRWARVPIVGRGLHVPPDAPAWSPDGRRIAISRAERIPFERDRQIGGTGIWAYDAGSGKREPIAIHRPGYVGELQFYRAPAWSPDGKRIAYLGEGVFGHSSLAVHTLGITNPSQQTPFVGMLDDDSWPTWSPSGEWLAFRNSLYRGASAMPVETIRLIAPGTTRSRTIYIKRRVTEPLRRVSHLLWSQDGHLGARVFESGNHLAGRTLVFNQSSFSPVESGQASVSIRGVAWTKRTEGISHLAWLHHSRGYFELEWHGVRNSAVKLPSDDYDISPDSRTLVASDPDKKGPSTETSLKVLHLP